MDSLIWSVDRINGWLRGEETGRLVLEKLGGDRVLKVSRRGSLVVLKAVERLRRLRVEKRYLGGWVG